MIDPKPTPPLVFLRSRSQASVSEGLARPRFDDFSSLSLFPSTICVCVCARARVSGGARGHVDDEINHARERGVYFPRGIRTVEFLEDLGTGVRG